MFSIFHSKKGLTLIEVLVAVLILGIVIVPLAGFISISSQRARRTAVERQAIALAESRMESLRQSSFVGFRLLAGDEDVVVEGEHGQFRIVTRASYDVDLEITRVTVTVSRDRVTVSLSTLVSRYR